MQKTYKFNAFRALATKKKLISKLLLPVFALSLLLVGIVNVASASATTWTGNGTTNGLCSDTSSNPNITGQNWLFILSSPQGSSWSLTASFSPATNPNPIVVSGVQQGGGSIHFTVNTAVGAQLLSASATNGTDNSVLTVSHCDVGKGTSTVSTTLHNAAHDTVAVGGSVSLGTIMHDLATVTPSGTTAPTGNVTFTFYNNGTCTGDGTAAGVVALNGANPGIAHPSNSSPALGAGSYAFKASWPGDTNYTGNTSDCENFTVNKAQLSVTTNVHNASHSDITNTSVALGTVTHDTATISGGVSGFALPAVSFSFTTGYTDSCANGAAVANNGTEGAAVKSADSAALAAGTYAYRASIASNDNYIGGDSACEPFTVNKAQLSVSTIVHDASHVDKTNASVPLGSIMHDTATIGGVVDGFAAPTTVSFTLTTGYTNSCANGTAVANDGTEGSANKSADSSPLGAGVYAYRATVTGNDNYLGSDSICEPFTVNKAQLTVTTNVHNASHSDITNTSIPLGSVTHDTATVTGGVNGFTVPAVSFTFTTGYTNACANGTAVANNGTEGGAVKSADSAALGAGSYAYRASVASDDNYIGGDSVCEPFNVSKAQLDVSTNIHDANHQIVTSVPAGSIVHDTASVTGGVSGFTFPAVTFTFYNNGTCTGDGTAVANTGADEGNASVVRSAASAALAAGSYSYKASVAGNDNYLGDSSDCEPLTVAGPTRTLGFWQTHYTFTNNVFNSTSGNAIWTICSVGRTINNLGTLYGGFYASIPKKSDGTTKRSDIDQARMQLMQQLLAAILNNLAFGGGSGSTLITNAKTAYCTGTKDQILNYAGQLDAFNNSGDSISTSQNTGNADPKATKAAANIGTWDILP